MSETHTAYPTLQHRRPNFLAPLFIALAVVLAAWILGNAWIRTHTDNEIISVTGLSEQNFESDLIVWEGSFRQKSMNMQAAYDQLKSDANQLKQYLTAKGVPESNIIFSAIDIQREYDYTYGGEYGGVRTQTFSGYSLHQTVTVESKEVDKIETISREVSELIKKGVELYSSPPQYFYTGLKDLKLKLIESATADARARAENIAENAKGHLGDLRYGSMGVFQITAQNSNEEYTYGGAFNTASKNKKASITVRLTFSTR